MHNGVGRDWCRWFTGDAEVGRDDGIGVLEVMGNSRCGMEKRV